MELIILDATPPASIVASAAIHHSLIRTCASVDAGESIFNQPNVQCSDGLRVVVELASTVRHSFILCRA